MAKKNAKISGKRITFVDLDWLIQDFFIWHTIISVYSVDQIDRTEIFGLSRFGPYNYTCHFGS
jgi:hypothetical protein